MNAYWFLKDVTLVTSLIDSMCVSNAETTVTSAEITENALSVKLDLHCMREESAFLMLIVMLWRGTTIFQENVRDAKYNVRLVLLGITAKLVRKDLLSVEQNVLSIVEMVRETNMKLVMIVILIVVTDALTIAWLSLDSCVFPSLMALKIHVSATHKFLVLNG